MKKIFGSIATLLLLLILMPACSKEDPFPTGDDANKPHSQASFAKMKEGMEVNVVENIVRSSGVDVQGFTVEVERAGKTYYSGLLADLPELLTLPVAEGYKVTVHSPENPASAWESPYYEGSRTFDVQEGVITYVEPIVCRLANVKVTVVFSAELKALMDDDCKVKVVTGDGASLTFSRDETRSGYFACNPQQGQENTLVATFSGTVDENREDNFRTYTSVKPGNHYIITYTLHGPGNDVPNVEGRLTLGAIVDSTVTDEDLTINVTDDDDILDDDLRPGEGEDPGPGPGPGPEPGGEAPQFELIGNVQWDTPTTAPADGMEIKVKVHSSHKDGITAFTVDIISDTLTADVLSSVGLSSHLDLVNPGQFADGLSGLGFPIYVGGQQDPAVMDISSFTKLLGIYGAATHKFKITVGDANGTTVKTLILVSE